MHAQGPDVCWMMLVIYVVQAQEGFLYPLERGFIWLYKPVINIPYDDVCYQQFILSMSPQQITSVSFARVKGSSSRSFDLEVETSNVGTMEFKNINREEYDSVRAIACIAAIHIVVVLLVCGGKGPAHPQPQGAAVGSMSCRHTTYFTALQAKVAKADSGDESDEQEYDPYLHRVRVCRHKFQPMR